MKKILIFGAASLCALGIAGIASAAEMTENSQDITAEYTIGSSYSVTIPADIIFTSTKTSVTDTVSIKDVLVDNEKSIYVSMQSANGALVNEDSYVPYSYTLDETTTTIAKATPYLILSAETGTTNIEKEITFTAGDLDHVTRSGRHADTLTFTVTTDGTGEVPVTPPASDLLVSNDDFRYGCYYNSGSLLTGGIYSQIKTHDKFFTEQKVKVVVTDTEHDVSSYPYKVVFQAYSEDGTILNPNDAGHLTALTNGEITYNLASRFADKPTAAKYRVDVLIYDGSFTTIPSSATINVYKVED